MTAPRRPAGRFLAPGARGDDLGYVHHPARAMPDEPECVGPAILDSYGADADYYATVAHAATVAEARVARSQLSPDSRLADAQRRARQQHRKDLRGEFAAVERLLERAGASGRHSDLRAALERLERVEAALDRAPDDLSAYVLSADAVHSRGAAL